MIPRNAPRAPRADVPIFYRKRLFRDDSRALFPSPSDNSPRRAFGVLAGVGVVVPHAP